MGQPDSLGLRYQAEQGTVAVEAPRPAQLHELQARFVVAVEQLVGNPARRILVGEFEGLRAEPLRADDRGEGVGQDAANGGVLGGSLRASCRGVDRAVILSVGSPMVAGTLALGCERRASQFLHDKWARQAGYGTA